MSGVRQTIIYFQHYTGKQVKNFLVSLFQTEYETNLSVVQ